jgi:VCBS repeat-containing protein
MKRILSFFLTVVVAAGLCFGAIAAEVDSDSVYCFTAGDFSQGEELVGICITGLPDAAAGTVMLGSRVLRSGDILTAEQISQMTFVPLRSEEDREALVTYLPIYENRVEPGTTMTISIRGKEDHAPVAEDSTLETYKNLANTGSLQVSDPEGSNLTYTLTRNPRRGQVTIHEDGTYTYTPKKNKVGTDSFTFTATDESGKVSREATVTVTVLKADSKQQYTDTVSEDCRFSAEWLKNTGLFVGETINGRLCFQPGKMVSRGEFVAMLIEALDIRVQEDAAYTGFDDDAPAWVRPYLAAAMRSGLTAGWPHGKTFGAEEPISGSEAALLLQNALDLPVSASHQEGAPEWAVAAMAAMAEHGISLSGEGMTRGQVAKALYQMSLLAPSAPGMRVFARQ